MAYRGNLNLYHSSSSRRERPRSDRQTRRWGLIVSLLFHILVGLCVFLSPLDMPQFVEAPVTYVELIEPPSEQPDAGQAKEAGGGGGSQSAAEPEPSQEAAEAESAPPTGPEVEIELPTQPQPATPVEVEPEPTPPPSLPTPIKPRLAILPAPPALALMVEAPPVEIPDLTTGFLTLADMALAQRAGGGAGDGTVHGTAGGSGSGMGEGQGSGSGSGFGSGSGSGRGTGASEAQGPGASCDMLARLAEAIRNAPQVQAAVAELSRNADAVGRALVIWDGAWITTAGQDGEGLAGVRQAVSVTVAFAPAECKAEPVRGFVVVDLAEGADAPRVALGKPHWRWNDLLEVERAR